MKNPEIGQQNFDSLQAIANFYSLNTSDAVSRDPENPFNIGFKNTGALQLDNGEQVTLNFGDPNDEKTWNEISVYDETGAYAYSWTIWANGKQVLFVPTLDLISLDSQKLTVLQADEFESARDEPKKYPQMAIYTAEKLTPAGDLIVAIEEAAKAA